MSTSNTITNYAIDIADAKAFVSTAVDLCYDPEGNYQPFIKDFAFNYAILKYFAKYPVEDKEIKDLYFDTYCGECVNIIADIKKSSGQLPHLIAAVEQELYIRIQKNIRQTKLNKIVDALIDAIGEELNKPETIETLKEISEQLMGDNDGKQDKD